MSASSPPRRGPAPSTRRTGTSGSSPTTSRRSALIHSDLLNRNVLVSGNRLSALLDWGNSMYGDFLYDVAWFCFWAPWYPKWQGVDFHREAARHYDSIGLDVPHLEERLRACQVHIGLDGQAYNAYKERWQDVETIAERTLAIARGAH